MRAGIHVPRGSSVLPLTAVAVVGASLVCVSSGAGAEQVGRVGSTGVSVSPARAVQTAAVSSPTTFRPVTPRVREVAMSGVEGATAARGLLVLSAPEPVRGYGVVGVTWRGRPPEGLDVDVRTRTGAGWSRWQPLYGPCSCGDESPGGLHGADGHRPDAITREGQTARRGTDPFAVGEVDAVQARATSPTGHGHLGLRLSVVNPGSGPLDAAGVASPTGAAKAAAAGQVQQGAMLPVSATAAAQVERYPGPRAPRPRIRSRRAWGADPRLRSGSPRYGRVKAGFVHHTVNANSYSRTDVPRIIRGIYAYHTQSLGWSDIGYNFLVDRFGRKWVGRYGGWRRAVIGAHTYGYNDLSTGMAAIGRFQRHGPPRRLVGAMGRIMGWKLGLHGVGAGDRSRWLEGKRFRAINGHRDAGQTACPGWRLYQKLRAVRRTAVRWQHR